MENQGQFCYRRGMSLSRRQMDVLGALQAHAAGGGRPPTLDELCRILGLASRGSMHKHVQALVREGYVEPMEGRQRGVRLIEQKANTTPRVPLLGQVAAGSPLDPVDPNDFVEIPPSFRTRKPCFAVRVRGDSMTEAGILDGDLVVAERRDSARVGDLVIALIDESEATLKRFRPDGDHVVLEPANAAMRPLRYASERVRIQGVVVSQLRRY